MTEETRKRLQFWVAQLKGPALWIAIGIMIGLMGTWSHLVEELQKIALAFVISMIVVGGVFIVQGIGFGSRNALAEFMGLLRECIAAFRDKELTDPSPEKIAMLQAMAIRNIGTLLSCAIIIHGLLAYMKP